MNTIISNNNLLPNVYNYESYNSIENKRYFNPISPCELDYYKLLHYNNRTVNSFNNLMNECIRNNDIILITNKNKDNYSNENDNSIIKISKNRMVRGYYSIQNVKYKLFEKEYNYYVTNEFIRLGDITKNNITDSFYYRIDNNKVKKWVIWILMKKRIDIGTILYVWDFIYKKSNDLLLLKSVYGRSIRNEL